MLQGALINAVCLNNLLIRVNSSSYSVREMNERACEREREGEREKKSFYESFYSGRERVFREREGEREFLPVSLRPQNGVASASSVWLS